MSITRILKVLGARKLPRAPPTSSRTGAPLRAPQRRLLTLVMGPRAPQTLPPLRAPARAPQSTLGIAPQSSPELRSRAPHRCLVRIEPPRASPELPSTSFVEYWGPRVGVPRAPPTTPA